MFKGILAVYLFVLYNIELVIYCG